MNKKIFSALLGISVLCLNGSALGVSGEAKNENEKGFLFSIVDTANKYKKPIVKIGITVGATILTLLGIRSVSNSCIFPGIHMDFPCFSNIQDGNIQFYGHYSIITRRFIEIGNLRGCSYKYKNPNYDSLRNKSVILFGPNADSAPNMVRSHVMETLLNRGATVVAVDYGGYGYSSLSAATLRISQGTLYNDGETIYKYVLKNLGYNSEDVIVFGFSLGGSVASHIADYASSKGQDLCGLILASPINSLYSAATNMTCKLLAAVARVVTMSALNTEDNLSRVNKNIPLFICSGDKYDFLSLEKTLLHQKVQELGFKNITTHIESNCAHNDLDKMFKRNNFEDYVNSLVR